MIKIIFSILFIFPVFASNYNVEQYSSYKYKKEFGERLLFILDFSNSMNEKINGTKKATIMIKTMSEILSLLDNNVQIGLRVYGYRLGFTPLEACRSSSLIMPFGVDKSNIIKNLDNLHPRGMTPITFSLKQAVKYDFMGFKGKKHIVLLTDGGENCDESPCKYVLELMKTRSNVLIDVIAFNMNEEEDLNQLKCTALVTNGKFYNANTSADLVNALSEIVGKKVDAKIISKD